MSFFSGTVLSAMRVFSIVPSARMTAPPRGTSKPPWFVSTRVMRLPLRTSRVT